MDEDAVMEQGMIQLRALLGKEWKVLLENDPYQAGALPMASRDKLLQIGAPDNSFGRMLVEAELNPQPSRLRDRLLPKLQLMQRLQGGQTSALVIAPWISPQTADLLNTWGCSYLDLTGNVSLRMDRPGLIIRMSGATQDPRPRAQQRGLSGPRAGSLVRVLADVRPPYRVQELAEATGVSQSYVSRLLDSLEQQGIIQRRKGTVESVDWEALLRTRAEQAALLSVNEYAGFLAPNGIDSFLGELKQLSNYALMGNIAVTGAMAAATAAPLVVQGQPMLYVKQPFSQIAKHHGLLSVAQAPDLILLRPKDPAPFQGARMINGLPHVAVSQLVLDCLSGPGRLPAAGEALLDTMRGLNENAWRLENLNRLEPLRA